MKALKLCTFMILGIISSGIMMAQQKSDWSVKPYGFIRTDYVFDSRKTANVREYQVNLYPLDKNLDANGEDINASLSSSLLAITSRFGLKVKGKKVWGAKTAAVIEGDFFGNTELNKSVKSTGSIGLLRLRHAYVKLDWAKTSLLLGQTWNPSFITDVYPGVANFNVGIMFNPFGRSAQIKLTQQITPHLDFVAVAYKDREFSAPIANEGHFNSGSTNSILPVFHGQLKYKKDHITAGIAGEYQSIKPTTVSNGLVSNERVNSAHLLAYFKYQNDKIIAKAYGLTGGNMHHLVMLGGYASYTKTNGQEAYQPIRTSSAWVDISSANKKIAPGMFFGYTQLSGAERDQHNKFTDVHGRGLGARMIDNVWRVSGRVHFKQNKFSVVPEIEYTSATFGDIDDNVKANANPSTVGNVRVSATAVYRF
ncbi:MAG: hypothetical protein CSA38_05215 [Flavobacteriales bacterium]|nr:MAG: hypothetical protein CSA38_05215 [Flavobacteriales bacterium]